MTSNTTTSQASGASWKQLICMLLLILLVVGVALAAINLGLTAGWMRNPQNAVVTLFIGTIIGELAAFGLLAWQLHRRGQTLGDIEWGRPTRWWAIALGLWSFLNPIHSPFMIIIGCFFLWVALKYVTLLLYAMSIVRRKSAQQEVAFELAHKETYARKYTLQTTRLLLVPLILPLLAVYQEVHLRSRQEL